MVRIGFWMRLLAAVIDGVIMFAIGFVVGLILPVATAVIVGSIIGLAYTTLEIFMAATPGKMILKYKITNQDGTPAPMDKLAMRWAYKQVPSFLRLIAVVTGVALFLYIGGLFGLLILIGAFFALQPEKLALHDKWFGTAVYGPGVDTQQGFPVQMPPPPTA